MTFTGGALLLLLDENLPELLTGARSLATTAQTYLDERDAKDRQLAEYDLLDRRRRSLISAANAMAEAVERALLSSTATLETATQFMLNAGVHSIQGAIGLDTGEAWSISIFQVEGEGSNQALRRIAFSRADRGIEHLPARSWKRNEGFAGAAWHNNREIVIADSSDPQVRADYPVPQDKRRDYDDTRYLAMVVIPIRVGGQVWGVVAASSDVKGRFRRDTNNHRAQNVDAVRHIARMTGLLAAGFGRG